MNGFYTNPSRPIVGFVVLLMSFFYSTSSYSQIGALATCDESNITATSTYVIEFTGLDAGTTYDITIDGVPATLNGNTSDPINYVDGLQTVDVVIVADPGTANETTTNIIVHEALCIDADADGDLDYNEATCDYTQPGPNFGTIVSTVAPYNGTNVYLYLLADENGILLGNTDVISNTTGHFLDLENGNYIVSAYTFLSAADMEVFRSSLEVGDDLEDLIASSPDVCLNHCGNAPYSVGCGDLITITTNPTDLELCEGEDGEMTSEATVSLSGPISGLPPGAEITYQWFVDNGAGFVALTDDTLSTLSFTDVEFALDENLYQVVAALEVNGNAVDADTSVSALLTVYQGITFTGDIDGEVCSDEASNIMLPSTDDNGVNIASYTISAEVDQSLEGDATTTEPGTSISSGTVISDQFVNEGSEPATVVYTLTPTSEDECLGESFEVVLTVNPEPVFAGTVENEVCSGEDAGLALPSSAEGNSDLNVDIASYNITADVDPDLTGTATEGTGLTITDGIINDQFTNTGTEPATVTYTVTPITVEGCEGESFEAVLTVNPVPEVEDIEEIVCSDEDILVDLAAVDVAGMDIDSFDVELVSVTSNLTPADDNFLDLAGTSTAENQTDISVISGDSYTNISGSAGTVVYTVTPHVEGCEGVSYDVTVTVATEPVGTDTEISIASDEAVDVNLADLIANGVSDVTFIWTATENSDVTGESTTVQTGSTIDDVLTNVSGETQTVVYTVTATTSDDNSCVSDEFTITVTICSEPTYEDEDLTTCSDEALDISITDNLATGSNAADGFTYVVTSTDEDAVPAGAERTDTTLANITDTYTNTTSSPVTITYTITPHTNEGCTGDDFTITVTIDPEPVLPTDLDGVVCTGSATGVNLSTTNGLADVTYELVSVDATGLDADGTVATVGSIAADGLANDVYTNPGATSLTVTYVVVAISDNDCESDELTITITVDPEVIVDAGEDEEICSTGTISLVDATITGALGAGTWTSSNGNSGSFMNDSGTNDPAFGEAVVYQPSAADIAAGQVVLTLTSDAPEGACDAVSDSITITINNVECGTFPWTGNE